MAESVYKKVADAVKATIEADDELKITGGSRGIKKILGYEDFIKATFRSLDSSPSTNDLWFKNHEIPGIIVGYDLTQGAVREVKTTECQDVTIEMFVISVDTDTDLEDLINEHDEIVSAIERLLAKQVGSANDLGIDATVFDVTTTHTFDRSNTGIMRQSETTFSVLIIEPYDT